MYFIHLDVHNNFGIKVLVYPTTEGHFLLAGEWNVPQNRYRAFFMIFLHVFHNIIPLPYIYL